MTEPLDEITIKINLETSLPLNNSNLNEEGMSLFSGCGKTVMYCGQQYERVDKSDITQMIGEIPIRTIKYKIVNK